MKKNIVKMIVNIVLTALFVVLLGLHATGQHAHEMIGRITAVLMVVHIILGFSWIKSVSKNFFTSKMTGRARLAFILNLLIFAGFVIIMITGPSMSDGISSHQMTLSLMRTKFLHTGTTYITLALIGIHIGLHMNQISCTFSKIIKPSKKVSQTLTLITVIICLSAGIFGLIETNYFRHANPVMSSEMTEMFKSFQEKKPSFEATTEERTDDHREERRERPEGKQNEGMNNILFGFLSLVFFVTLTFAVDTYLIRKKS